MEEESEIVTASAHPGINRYSTFTPVQPWSTYTTSKYWRLRMCMHFISAICKQEFKTGKSVGHFPSIISLWELIQTNEYCHFMTMYIVDVIKQKNKLLKRTIPNKLNLNGHTFPYFRQLSRFRVLYVQWRSYFYSASESSAGRTGAGGASWFEGSGGFWSQWETRLWTRSTKSVYTIINVNSLVNCVITLRGGFRVL